jgi:hypothetical protein
MAQPNFESTQPHPDDRASDSSRRRAEARAEGERVSDGWTDDDAAPGRAEGRGAMSGSEDSWQRWWQIQANFVDDPHSAVAEAHGLIGNLLEDLVRRFENERKEIEGGWAASERDISTEDLRCALQRYRELFGRLQQKA